MRRALTATLILLLGAAGAGLAQTTYTCPGTFLSHDADYDTTVYTDLNNKYITVSMNLFTNTTSGWSYTADMSNVWPCQVFGFVVDQGARVLLQCACVAPEQNGLSPIQTATTYIVAGGGQCSYQGDLTFSCQ